MLADIYFLFMRTIRQIFIKPEKNIIHHVLKYQVTINPPLGSLGPGQTGQVNPGWHGRTDWA